VIFIYDDNALMEQVKRGSKKAFDELVLLYRKSAVGFAYRLTKDSYLSEDIVQESFAAIYINRSTYKPKSSFKAFLFAVVRNRCIDYFRKNNKIVSTDYDEMDIPSEEFSAYQIIEFEQKLIYAKKLLNKLNAEYRTAFYLCEYEGFSYKEISEVMSKSLPQVKVIIHRARNKIKKYIKEDMQYEK
jgi:RNA polymerase sigma-70 factor (ECF subfamily)